MEERKKKVKTEDTKTSEPISMNVDKESSKNENGSQKDEIESTKTAVTEVKLMSNTQWAEVLTKLFDEDKKKKAYNKGSKKCLRKRFKKISKRKTDNGVLVQK